MEEGLNVSTFLDLLSAALLGVVACSGLDCEAEGGVTTLLELLFLIPRGVVAFDRGQEVVSFGLPMLC